ncbi:MAG: alpha/beta fold hydrolase [Massilia sp.]|nr:alpha/beta fold hydrolase [Massilia sp.]
MRALATMLLVATVLYALVCLGIYVDQRKRIYYPAPRATAAESMQLAVDGATLVVTTRALEAPAALIYFGGNAEDVSGSLQTLAQAFPGHALYLLHYRGYGGSTGEPTEANLFADARALFDKAHARHRNVVLIGRSLGSGVAMHLASERPVARMVLVTPYDSLADIAAHYFPWLPIRLLMKDKFDSWRYVPKVGVPVTVIMAEHDEIIPRANSERLLARFAPGQARAIVIPGAGHNDLSAHPAYVPALRSVPAQ